MVNCPSSKGLPLKLAERLTVKSIVSHAWHFELEPEITGKLRQTFKKGDMW